MKDLTQTYEIKAPVEKVWAALTDPTIINAWGGGPAIMDGEVGTEFSLWGGEIHGKNTEVEEEKKLVQDWYGGDWSAPSVCEFSLEGTDGPSTSSGSPRGDSRGGHTTLTLNQANIPDDEFDAIEDGWKTDYLGALQKLVEKS